MRSKEYKTLTKNLCSRLSTPTVHTRWPALKARINEFRRAYKYTWGGAFWVLIEKGLNQFAHEEQLLKRALAQEDAAQLLADKVFPRRPGSTPR